jgi:hypothetical protein
MLVLTDKITHPPLGAWVWGNRRVAYQITRRFERGGEYWLTLATDSGPVEMPLARVAGWAESPPPPTAEATPPPPIEAPPKAFQPGDHVRYQGGGWLGSQMRPLLSGKKLVVKSIQHTPTEGNWVTCYVPNGLDQTVPASNLKHFY